MDGPLRCFSQMRLKLGEGHLDGIEVGAVGRKEQETGTCGFDAARTAGALWLDRLSMMTTLPGESSGTRTRVT